VFCDYDDYNWDWSLQYVGVKCLPNKLCVCRRAFCDWRLRLGLLSVFAGRCSVTTTTTTGTGHCSTSASSVCQTSSKQSLSSHQESITLANGIHFFYIFLDFYCIYTLVHHHVTPSSNSVYSSINNPALCILALCVYVMFDYCIIIVLIIINDS